jgi:hypothetical protein
MRQSRSSLPMCGRPVGFMCGRPVGFKGWMVQRLSDGYECGHVSGLAVR